MDNKNYDHEMEDKRQEYSRLNDELLMRIKNCYGDGVMLASFYLIFYATLIGVFCEFLLHGADRLCYLVFIGCLAAIAFSVPILILYAFAQKFKENFLGVCNISQYLIFYHEIPSLSQRKDLCKKWENLHKNTIKETSHENQEYTLLAVLSLCLFIASMSVVLYLLFRRENFNIGACLGVGALALFFLILDICCLIQIIRNTSLKWLKDKRDEIHNFYEAQIKEFGLSEADMELYQKMKRFEEVWKYEKTS